MAEEHGFVAMGGQADQVTAVLKDHYADGLPLVRALGAAIAGLAGQGQGNGDGTELSASQLEVGILDRDRVHRTFRRLTGPRLEVLLAEVEDRAEGAATGRTGQPGKPGTRGQAGHDGPPEPGGEDAPAWRGRQP